MSPSSLPPEEQLTVKSFQPVDLDRTIIALPLLRDMKADLERIAQLLKIVPDAVDKFNAAVEYNANYPAGIAAARDKAVELMKAAADKAHVAAQQAVQTATGDALDLAKQRLADLEGAIAEQTIEPPLANGLPYSLARLHASVIKRILNANERLRSSDEFNATEPICAIHPRRFEVIIDLNLEHPGGRTTARDWVISHIAQAKEETKVRDAGQQVYIGKDRPDSQFLFARLEARVIQKLVELDVANGKADAEKRRANAENDAVRRRIDPARCRAIFHIWPDFEVSATITKSIATIKCDAAQQSFSASGAGITWAVMDSGISKDHKHFAMHGNIDPTSPLHHDFTLDGSDPFNDENGHGTHVAGIIAGEWRVAADTPDAQRPLAVSRTLKTDTGDVELHETRLEGAAGMAPKCKLVSLRVLDENGKGSVSNLIAAIQHIQEINGYGRRLIIHGVNMSVGYNFEPEWFACGQSPLCVEVDRLVKSGVVVVVAAGNTGYGTLKSSIGSTAAGMPLTINDPGNADFAITVGSTHRDMPHTYGVSYFSSKGPTGDGRMKPDLVAPGEKIISCAAGQLKTDVAKDVPCDYVETSGTSMAAPHVSGAIAGFLSVRSEFVGNPERVKDIFVSTCTDLRRDRYFQGAGLVDLMRAIQSV
jgi:subtilisin family serine protease